MRAPVLVGLCLAILGALAAWSLGITALSPIDDHHFVATLFSGKPFGYYSSPREGRFFPLTSQEYVLAAKAWAPSARLFHLIATLKIVAAGLLLLPCLARTRASAWTVAILWCVAVLSEGFANATLRLQVGEINVLILTLVFVWSRVVAEEGAAKSTPRRHVIAATGLCCMGLAFFYKETAFVLALGCGAAELARHARQGRRPPLGATVLVGMAAAYLVAYTLWRGSNVTSSYLDSYAMSRLHLLYLYAVTDPFIVLVAIPLAAFRTFVVLRDPSRHTLYDSFLAAAALDAAAYVVLGIHNNYYLLPAYGFAVCGVAGILASRDAGRIPRPVLALCALIVANTLPATLSDMVALRSIPNNHDEFVAGLSAWMRANPLPGGARRNVVLVGVSPASGVEVLHSLATFLRARGVADSAFDLRATEPVDNEALRAAHRANDPSFSFSADEGGYRPHWGDVLVFNPYQQVRDPPPAPSRELREILATGSQWAPPRWWAVHWAWNCLLRPASCGTRLAMDRRYTGYAAMIVAAPE